MLRDRPFGGHCIRDRSCNATLRLGLLADIHTARAPHIIFFTHSHQTLIAQRILSPSTTSFNSLSSIVMRTLYLLFPLAPHHHLHVLFLISRPFLTRVLWLATFCVRHKNIFSFLLLPFAYLSICLPVLSRLHPFSPRSSRVSSSSLPVRCQRIICTRHLSRILMWLTIRGSSRSSLFLALSGLSPSTMTRTFVRAPLGCTRPCTVTRS